MNKGLSPLMATIILIAIVAVGALSTAFFILGNMKNLSEGVHFFFDRLSLLKGERCVLTVTLRNTGTKPISVIKVFVGGEERILQVGVLEPGKTMDITVDLPPEKFNVGNTYTFSLEAEAPDGSRSAFTTTVMCLWSDL